MKADNKHLIFVVSLLFLCFPCIAFAAIFFDMDTTTTLKCTFSSIHQNRIAVSGGRIAKAILPEGKVVVQMEEESGQVFVYALGFIADDTTLSVVTDKGLVQDLEISFRDQSSEVVILRVPNAEIDCKESSDPLQIVPEIITDILHGEVPSGYTFFECNHEKIAISNNMYSKMLARFEGECETIYLYKLFNCTRKDIYLQEQQFVRSNTNWVYLVKNTLDSNSETFLIIAVGRNE